MTRNTVVNLWTAVVTTFLALCTSLGLITTTAVAAVPATEAARNTGNPQDATAQEEPTWTRPRASSLPPTMKQRIHAEAHGSSPSCRHRPPTDAMDTEATGTRDSAEAPAVVAAVSAAVPTAVDTTDFGVRKPVTRDVVAAPARPCGTTHLTTGAVDVPAAQAVRAAPPATPAGQTGPAAPATDAAPISVVMLPSQSSAPVQLPAPAHAPVLAAVGSATRG